LGPRWSARGDTTNCCYNRQLATDANYLPYSATPIARRIPDIVGRRSTVSRAGMEYFAELNGVIVAAIRPRQRSVMRH
jgi:hypothetical protein